MQVLHNTNTLAMFMSTDQTFFTTVLAHKLAASEEHLALLVAHELAHYLLDHQVKRTFVFLCWQYLHK